MIKRAKAVLKYLYQMRQSAKSYSCYCRDDHGYRKKETRIGVIFKECRNFDHKETISDRPQLNKGSFCRTNSLNSFGVLNTGAKKLRDFPSVSITRVQFLSLTSSTPTLAHSVRIKATT